jgi:hypothetical protein
MAENREKVTIDELAVSNMISIEALVNVLIAKGIVTQDEIIKEIYRLKQIDHGLRQDKS